MGGMDMSSSGGLLRNVNEPLAHDFWFIIAGLVGAMLLLRMFEKYEIRSRSVTGQTTNSFLSSQRVGSDFQVEGYDYLHKPTLSNIPHGLRT